MRDRGKNSQEKNSGRADAQSPAGFAQDQKAGEQC
jgi:hypothetical protein